MKKCGSPPSTSLSCSGRPQTQGPARALAPPAARVSIAAPGPAPSRLFLRALRSWALTSPSPRRAPFVPARVPRTPRAENSLARAGALRDVRVRPADSRPDAASPLSSLGRSRSS